LFGARGRFERRLAAAREAFERAGHEHDRAEMLRQQWVRQQRARHDEAVRAHRSEVEHHNRRVEAVAIGRRERDRESVQAYLELALARTPLPDDLPREVEVAYSARGEQAVVRFELPTVEVVPQVAFYTYVVATATMRQKARPAGRVAQLYRSLVSQIALLYMRDLFEADPDLDNVELGGHVHAINPAIGLARPVHLLQRAGGVGVDTAGPGHLQRQPLHRDDLQDRGQRLGRPVGHV
jgi:restriction system protein